MKRLILAGTLLTLSSATLADGTPWLPEPGTTTASLSYIFQSADEFYAGDSKMDLPDDLDQQTVDLSLSHGLTDSLSLDFKGGYSRTTFDPAAPDEHIEGLMDTNIGVNWRFIDEFTSNSGLPSTVLRVGAIIEGDYRTDAINSIGEGSDGVEISLISGKILNSWSAVSGEIGYRARNSGAPNDNFYKVEAFVFPVSGFVASVSYSVTNARDGYQLTDPDFTPDHFPDLEEDTDLIGASLSYSFTNSFSAGVNVATVVDGRNTADNQAYALTLSYTH